MDSVIYGTLIAVCASNNQCKEAEDYFKQMKDAGHSPNAYHYSSLLNAYSIEGDYKMADDLFQDMKLAGLVPNKVCFHAILLVKIFIFLVWTFIFFLFGGGLSFSLSKHERHDNLVLAA